MYIIVKTKQNKWVQ